MCPLCWQLNNNSVHYIRCSCHNTADVTHVSLISFARFLIEAGVNVSLVNNDGDLAIDIAESDEMDNMLKEELCRQGNVIGIPT